MSFVFRIAILAPVLFLSSHAAAMGMLGYEHKIAPKMVFPRACEAGDHLIISAVGDVLPQAGLSRQAYASPLGFKSLWQKAIPYFLAADLSYGNLEGAVAPGVRAGGVNGVEARDPGPHLDGVVYSATNFSFNYHPMILTDLKDSGFDIMSNANNHIFDRGVLGVDRTIESYEKAGMPWVGARHSGDSSTPFYTIMHEKGFKLAFIGCVDFMNVQMGSSKQVLLCGQDSARIVSMIRDLSEDASIDAVIINPHWGTEYHHNEDSAHRALAHRFLDAGATAIIGSHPHVLQELEQYRTADGRDTVVAYSLGNFVSVQGAQAGERLTAILFLGLTKRAGERAWINGVSFIPMWMDRAPFEINTLEQTNQAPKADLAPLLNSLFDKSRRLAVGDAVRTDLDCR